MDYASTPGEPFLYPILETDVRPRQNILDEEEEILLLAHVKMLMRKRLRAERMLSPHARPVYYATENNQIATERRTKKAPSPTNVAKEDAASNLQVDVEQIILKT